MNFLLIVFQVLHTVSWFRRTVLPVLSVPERQQYKPKQIRSGNCTDRKSDAHIIQQVAGSRRRRQRGRMVKAPDMKFRGRWFKSDSDHKLELFLSRPRFKFSVMFLKSQLVCLPPDRRPKSVPSLFYLFFQLVSGQNSTNPAIWLVPGAAGMFYSMVTIVHALLTAERALFSCNDRALWNFSPLNGSYKFWAKLRARGRKQQKMMTK